VVTSYFYVCKLWVLPLKQTIDEIFVRKQGLWSSKFVQNVSGQ